MPLQQTALALCARPVQTLTPREAVLCRIPHMSSLSPATLCWWTDKVGATEAKSSLSVYSGEIVHFETTRIDASFLRLLFLKTSTTVRVSKRVDAYGLAGDLK